MTTTEMQTSSLAMLTVEEVASLTGLGVRTIWKRLRAGKFPRPLPIPGVRATRWTRSSVESWIRRLAEKA